MQFVEVFIRQAHPGPNAPPYRTFEQKLADARRFKREENLPWPLLVDDLAGTVHQVYGTLADPTYLIDANGRVAYYNMWTLAPALHKAIEMLLKQRGWGIVEGGINHTPNLLPTIIGGWKGLRRGLPQSYVDLELALPTSATMIWLGNKLRPLLGPLALRAEPIPTGLKLAAGAGLAVSALMAALTVRQRQEDQRRAELERALKVDDRLNGLLIAARGLARRALRR
ncbi:MAG: hypothetical protein HZC41_26360 [Chloroflexi bacterium]|nr:hypothetical protein [Chloroflexota bacterium]